MQNNHMNFIPPEQVLQGLIGSSVGQCNCNETQRQSQGVKNHDELEEIIENLHAELDGMNHEVIEVESLLNQRDMLYHQLDHLRQEREQIEDEISHQQTSMRTQSQTKISRGLKEMNDRLRRRIKEVKEYIEKMDIQNQKIEQALSIHSNADKFHSYTEYNGSWSPTWVQKLPYQHNYQPYNLDSNKKFHYDDYFSSLKKRIQAKQEEAWQRVRKQEQQIHNRNARSQFYFTGFRGGKKWNRDF